MENTVINTVNGVLDSNNVEDIEMVNVENTKYRLYVSRSYNDYSCTYTVPVESLEDASKAYQPVVLEDLIKEMQGYHSSGFVVLQMYDEQLCKWVKAVDDCGKAIELEVCIDEIRRIIRGNVMRFNK